MEKPKLNNCGCGGTPHFWTKNSLYFTGFVCVFVRCEKCGGQTTEEVFRPQDRRHPVLDKHIYRDGSDSFQAYEAAAKYWNDAHPAPQKEDLRDLIGEIISECDIEPSFSEDGDAVVGYSVDLPSYYFEQILGLAGFKTFLDAQSWLEQQ